MLKNIVILNKIQLDSTSKLEMGHPWIITEASKAKCQIYTDIIQQTQTQPSSIQIGDCEEKQAIWQFDKCNFLILFLVYS